MKTRESCGGRVVVLWCAAVALAACGGGGGGAEEPTVVVPAPAPAPVLPPPPPAPAITLVAGSLEQCASGSNGTDSVAFQLPRGVAQDADGNVFVADTDRHAIKRVAPDGTVTLVAGSAGQPGTSMGRP